MNCGSECRNLLLAPFIQLPISGLTLAFSQVSMASLRSASRSLRALIRDSRITRAPSCTKSASSSTRTFHNYTKYGYASTSTSAHPSGAGSWTEPTAYDLVPIVIEQSVGAP